VTLPPDPCKREVLEETAQRFEPTKPGRIYRWHYAAQDVTFLRFCFQAKSGVVEDRAHEPESLPCAG